MLEKLGEDETAAAAAQLTALALGRAYKAWAASAEADTAYRWASQHLPGFEGLVPLRRLRLERHGRKDEATLKWSPRRTSGWPS